MSKIVHHNKIVYVILEKSLGVQAKGRGLPLLGIHAQSVIEWRISGSVHIRVPQVSPVPKDNHIYAGLEDPQLGSLCRLRLSTEQGIFIP